MGSQAAEEQQPLVRRCGAGGTADCTLAMSARMIVSLESPRSWPLTGSVTVCSAPAMATTPAAPHNAARLVLDRLLRKWEV